MFKRLALLAPVIALAGCSSLRDAPDNPGPCPSALTLYDASRVVNLHGEPVYENVGFTGEIMAVRSLCRYYDDRPIVASLELDMGFGRGPAATGSTHTYQFFVAVTRRDVAVIEKQVFPIEVTFRPGEDRIYLQEEIDEITIPRATAETAGDNFEIIVGFELTPEQLAWNRAGQRFRVDAGQDD